MKGERMMGGKSRKRGQVSKKLIDRLTQNSFKNSFSKRGIEKNDGKGKDFKLFETDEEKKNNT